MKEIRILMSELRGYPDNFFVYPQEQILGGYGTFEKVKEGLVVCDMDGDQLGFITTGGAKEEVK